MRCDAPPMTRVDAHQHFWHYDSDAYPWIGANMPALRRDCLPADLKPLLDAQLIDACIAVQARADEADNAFLLGLADENPWIVAVVGWVDLFADNAGERLAHWKRHPRFAGVRHLLQDDADVAATLADPRFDRGVRMAQGHSLAYEVLVRGAAQLAETPAFCARHDRHWLVLDHLGKPAIGGNEDAHWRAALDELAAMPHVLCKLSGLVTEAVRRPVGRTTLRRYLDAALEAFGPQRLLFGSDWPVCLLRDSYAAVAAIVADWAGTTLSADECAALWGGNAVRCYGLPR